MPHVTAGLVEGRLDGGNLIGQRRHHILWRIFHIALRLSNRRVGPGEIHKLESLAIGSRIPRDGIVLHRWLCGQVGAIADRSGSGDAIRVKHPVIFVGSGVPDYFVSIKNIKVDQMQMHRVGVSRGVPDLPLLGGIEGRVLGGGAVPGDGPFHLTCKTNARVY